HDHAHAIVHPPRRPQFPHPRIHNGITGEAPLPGAERALVVAPREAGELLPQRLRRRVRKVKEQVMGELAPADLADEVRGAVPSLEENVRMDTTGLVPDAAGTDLSKVQMR